MALRVIPVAWALQAMGVGAGSAPKQHSWRPGWRTACGPGWLRVTLFSLFATATIIEEQEVLIVPSMPKKAANQPRSFLFPFLGRFFRRSARAGPVVHRQDASDASRGGRLGLQHESHTSRSPPRHAGLPALSEARRASPRWARNGFAVASPNEAVASAESSLDGDAKISRETDQISCI